MRWDAFFGGTYESQATTADCERTTNWYPEKLESPGATATKALYPTPGVEQLSSASGGAGRAHIFALSREFAVIGTTFYEVASGGALTSRGTVALGEDPATISSNGDLGGQLFVTSGGNGYIFDTTTNILTEVTALSGKATMGDYLDGYFIALDAATSTFYFSNLAPDGEVWDTGEDFGKRSLAPDRWLSMKVIGRTIAFLGETTSEFWYDTGARFPFAPQPSGLLQYGILAPFSVQVIGNELVFLGTNEAGKKCVLTGQGEIVSDKALEAALESYDGISGAVGDVYSERGHTFYLLNFDQNNVTKAWDSATRLWSDRGTWITGDNRFVSWRPRFYASAFGEHRILDAFGGAVYRMSVDLGTDVDGLPIKRVRRAPAISKELKRVVYNRFELDLEPGLGNSNPMRASFTMAESIFTIDVDTTPEEGLSGQAPVVFDYTVTGGTAPYTYSLAWTGGGGGGPNTDEDPTVTFTGTPLATETIPFVLTVTDDDGLIGSFEGSEDVQYHG